MNMMSAGRRAVAIGLLWAALAWAAPGPVADDGAPRRVLFVGNSLTFYNEMPWMVAEMARARGVEPPLVTVFSGGDGLSFRRHWEAGEVTRLLQERPFDVVVLQGQSSETLDRPVEARQFASLLARAAQAHGARVVLFSNWATANRDAVAQARIDRFFRELADELGADLAPVGAAAARARAEGIELLRDGVHGNLAGSYLAACVFLAVLTGESPVGAIHRFDVGGFEALGPRRESLLHERLPAPTAALLQRSAWEAVRHGTRMPY